MPQVVAAGGSSDHVGAHVGQQHRAEGANRDLRLIENAQAIQRAAGSQTPW
jgi:hypothetical protein